MTYILWLFLASYVMFGDHSHGRKKKKKKEDRFFFIGIVDKKSQDGAGNPHPPPL
jgi:hypothetical protein